MGRVTKGDADASRTEPALADASRRNPRPVRWSWIDIGPDDQTLRIEFDEGVMHGLHHIEIDEGEDDIRVTVFLGMDPDASSGAYAAVGLPKHATAMTSRPVANRRISDGFERPDG
jgi:hypothetical protein